MKIRTVTFDRLTNEEIAAWDAIQRAEPMFASPYFRPEFTQAVADIRKSNVEVGVLEEDGRPVGFFPYERRRWNHGMPVGTRLSDYHGVIAPASVPYDPIELVRGCGLSCWSFDHLVTSTPSLERFVLRYAESPYIDLSHGFDAYEKTVDTHVRSELRRRRKKLESSSGPIRFEFDVRDSAVFSTLLAWKTAQYQRTGLPDIVGIPWVRDLLERILDFRDEAFSGVISVLYAGDAVLAITYQLRCGTLLHSWFPAYNREKAEYGPGILFIFELLRSACSRGITRIDMGKGPEDYKQRLRSGATRIGEGTLDPQMLRAGVRSAWWTFRDRVRSTPLHSLVKRPARTAYLLKYWRELH